MSYTLDFPIQYIPNPDRFASVGLGKLFIGVTDGDPANDPEDRIPVYASRQNDTDLEIPQPVDISPGGVFFYQGSPISLKINQAYSVAVLDRNGAQVFYVPKAGEIIGSVNYLTSEIQEIRDIVDNINSDSILAIDNFSAISSYPAVPGNVYYLKEYVTGSGKGGGFLIGRSGALSPNNFKTFASSESGVYLERIGSDINTDYYGLSNSNSVAVNSNRLISMLAYAVANGIKRIDVGTEFTVDDVTYPIHDKGLVFFHGKQISGLYRRDSLPEDPVSNIKPFEPIDSRSLQLFSTTSNPVVVMMGDSISGYSVSDCTPVDSMWGVITEEIKLLNPKNEFVFYNRGVGGQVWANANTTANANYPAWYTDPDREWLEYVKDVQPDLLFLAFGMNDSSGFDAASMHAVLTKINAWPKVPDIVLVTTPNPAMSTRIGGSGSGFYSRADQEGRDYVAGYVRAAASYYGYGLLDINRQTNLLRDGRDIISCPMGIQKQVTGSWVQSATKCHAYYFNGGIASWPDLNSLRFIVGAGSEDWVTIIKNGADFNITARTSGAGNYKVINYTAPSPTAVQSLSLSVTATQIVIAVNGDAEIARFNCLRHGGEFTPRASFAGLNSGPFASYVLSLGHPEKVNQTLTDDMIYGSMGTTGDSKEPDGGNGVNHYSSQGVASVVRPVVRQADFSVRQPYIMKLRTGILSPLSGTVTVYQNMIAERMGNVVTLKGIVAISGAALETNLCQLPSTMIPVYERVLNGKKLVGGNWVACAIVITAGGLVKFFETAPADRVSIDVSFLI